MDKGIGFKDKKIKKMKKAHHTAQQTIACSSLLALEAKWGIHQIHEVALRLNNAWTALTSVLFTLTATWCTREQRNCSACPLRHVWDHSAQGRGFVNFTLWC